VNRAILAAAQSAAWPFVKRERDGAPPTLSFEQIVKQI